MSTPAPPTSPPQGRPAVQELAELLLLRRRPAAVAIGGVLGVGLLLALVGVLPATPLVGLLVGLFALLVALGAMVATDAVDPVVRGPRHVRVSGRPVIGRVRAEPRPRELDGAVDQLVAALQLTRHLRVVVTGVAHDPRAVAEALVRGTARAGHSALLVDCGERTGEPGISDTRDDDEGSLAAVVRIDEQVRMASTGAGTVPGDAVAAAARLAAVPPSDLDLLVTVLPDGELPPAGLLAHTERLVVVVPLDVLERDELDRRLSRIEGTRSTQAAVVVVDVPPVRAPTPPAAPGPAPEATGHEDDEGDDDGAPDAADDAAAVGAQQAGEPDDVAPVDADPAEVDAVGVDAVDGDAGDAPATDGSPLASLAEAAADAAAAVDADVDTAADGDGQVDVIDVADDAPTIVDVTVDAAPVGPGPDDTAPLELPELEDADHLALRTAAALESLAEDVTPDR